MTTHDQTMLDGIIYAEQCLASCFLTSTKQKPSMSSQNLPEETAKYLPHHPHNYYFACNVLGQSRGENTIMLGEVDEDMELDAVPHSCPV